MNFSLKSSNKPPKKPQLSKPSQQKQFISEFDPSKPPLNPNPNTLTTTITPISNNWRKPLDLPTKSDDPNLAFESSSLSVDPADASNLTYGLNVRKKGTTPSKSVNVDDDNVFTGKSGSAIDSIMISKLRGDLDNLPEDRGLEEFDEMPVENFASALLKGYGWEEGMGVGKNKKDVKVVEFKQRSSKQGLGFVDDMPAPPSNEKSSVRHENSRKENGSVEKTKSGKRGRERYEREETSVGRGRNWLNSRIRVRVISKELKHGRLYLKKGEIVDVVGPTTCDVAMDEGREIIQGVEQEDLETALPRRGGPVLVLYGRYKGVYGSLQEKDMDRETAVVRHADTHELLSVKLEQIAEYVGDPDDIGGMLVQDPNKRNDVDEIFNQARQSGGVEGPMENLRPSSSRSFTGTGRLLSGEPVPAPAAPEQPQNVIHNIVFWRNGFTVNDGPLRRLDDPENAPFLESIRKSECPRELEPADRRSSVHVNLIRRDENCPEPVVATQVAFQGVGRTLGRNTDDAAPDANAAPTSAPSAGLVLDSTLPSTSIQLRLADGTRMVAHFNLHHTVSDIRAFINSSRPDGPRTYQLQTVGFPPKQLTDQNQTIEQAGLANSVVIQKI